LALLLLHLGLPAITLLESQLFSQIDIAAPDVSDVPKRRRLADQVEERYFLDSGLPGRLFQRKIVYLDYPPEEPGIGILDQAMREGCCDR